MNEQRDEKLWKLAKARAEFKTHFLVYIVVNSMLWVLWIFTSGVQTYPWPVWPTAGWGIGLIFNYLSVYKFWNSVEKEYENLKKKG